jgi:hypothetical protein
MSEQQATNVDLSAVKLVIGQLGDLSTSLRTLSAQMNEGGDLSWTGTDNSGNDLRTQLAPADQGSVDAVTAASQGVDGLIDGLGTTAGLWKHTEGTNIGLSR